MSSATNSMAAVYLEDVIKPAAKWRGKTMSETTATWITKTLGESIQ